MKRLHSQFCSAFLAAALSLTITSAAGAAAVTPNNVKNSSGGAATVVPVLTVDQSGNYVAAGGGGGGGAATVADGADVTQGAIADAAVAAGAAGTLNAKLRRLTTDLAAVLAKIIAAPATEAKQDNQITQETAIAGGVGTTADAAATQGSTGSVSAKLRTVTSQLNTQAGYLDGLETAIAALPQNNTLAAGTTGGCTPAKTLSAASTNATSVKGSAGTLCSLTVINTTAVIYYLKFYDKATAATCNSDTVIQTIPIPASTTGAGVAVPVGPYGWAFPTGITFCLTGALADNDNTNAATGVAINYSYK